MFKSTPADLDGKCVVTLTLRKGRGDGYVRSIDFMRKTSPLEHRAVIAPAENEFQERVIKCMAILDEQDLPSSAGRPSCAGALRQSASVSQ